MLVDEFSGNADILVQMDPCDPTACPICTLNECTLRSRDPDAVTTWNRERLVRSTDKMFPEEKPEE
jgi:hypothetical protein